jgi:hypothetical protein
MQTIITFSSRWIPQDRVFVDRYVSLNCLFRHIKSKSDVKMPTDKIPWYSQAVIEKHIHYLKNNNILVCQHPFCSSQSPGVKLFKHQPDPEKPATYMCNTAKSDPNGNHLAIPLEMVTWLAKKVTGKKQVEVALNLLIDFEHETSGMEMPCEKERRKGFIPSKGDYMNCSVWRCDCDNERVR